MAMLIDSHAHLEMSDFAHDREEVIKRGLEAGVGIIVTVGTVLPDCEKAVAIAEAHEEVYAAVGIHPHEAKGIDGKTYDRIKKLAVRKKVVAYGEIGLDFFRDLSPRDMQIKGFGEQLEIASELNLPVIIHDREAHRETLEMLKAWKGKRGGIVHCFSGDVAMAKQCIDMGFYISIPGAVTFAKSEQLQTVARDIPLSHLLVETDAPYLTPVPFRGKRNEPAYVAYTALKLAEVKNLSLEEVAEATTRNAKEIFGL